MGLKHSTLLCIDAHVSLMTNEWTQKGLVNGSFGIVKDIVFPKNYTKESLPIAIIVYFPDYVGPQFFQDEERHIWISVNPKCAYSKLVKGTRTQLPLRLNYALTIHKSQGQTLQLAVIDLEKSEMSLGLTFVALSRLKNVNDFLIAPFPNDRLTRIKNSKSLQPRLEEEERLSKLKEETLKKYQNLLEN